MKDERIELEAQLYFYEYISYFNEYYQLLLARYERFNELREKDEWNLDIDTYFDMLIVQLRSMLLDRQKNSNVVTGNYTMKNIIFLGQNTEAWNAIDDMLNEIIISGGDVKEDCKLRDAIKIVADKSICHYDNFYRDGSHSWELIQLLKSILSDKNARINIDYIMNVITSIFHDGVDIEFNN